jgi:chromosomal replication initiation ATPase DnaA
MTRSAADRTYEDFLDRYAHVGNLLIDNIWILKSRPFAAEEMGRLIRTRKSGRLKWLKL